MFSQCFAERWFQCPSSYLLAVVLCAMSAAFISRPAITISDTGITTRNTVPLYKFFTLGILLVILPALPIALCNRYQHELMAGLGHLPVYDSRNAIFEALAAGTDYQPTQPARGRYELVNYSTDAENGLAILVKLEGGG